MPKRYEAMRDSIAQKKPYDEAQRIAAATYNKTKKKGEPPLSSKPSISMETAMKGLGKKY